jgi:hypothetical protein
MTQHSATIMILRLAASTIIEKESKILVLQRKKPAFLIRPSWPQFHRFLRFGRFDFSITCVFSIGVDIPPSRLPPNITTLSSVG